jgi:hypothetical protein
MTETTVATDVHQTLDVHGGFAAQVTLDGELSDLVADLFEISVRQILDLFGIGDATSFANLARAGATNAEDGGETDLRVLVRRNIDTSDTCHVRPLKPVASTLALLVTGIGADHTNHALATDDFAVAANFLDRSRNSHFTLLTILTKVPLGAFLLSLRFAPHWHETQFIQPDQPSVVLKFAFFNKDSYC